MKRSGGILCHISSLPSAHGIGTFGRAAFDFADFLAQAGQGYWQVLPLGPTGYGDSPYQCNSTFAGNPYFIDLDLLRDEGLLSDEDLTGIDWGEDPGQADYGKIYANRGAVLRKAFCRGRERDVARLAAFCEQNRAWLDGFALYSAVKAHFNMKPWDRWDADIRLRTPEGLEKYRALLREDIAYHCYVQYLFFTQWDRLHAYLAGRGVRVIGDLPVYVPYDSADVWEHPELFLLDGDARPRLVAGVPPDYFSSTGQLWGNPIYDYARMEQDGYRWWQQRLTAAGRLFDAVRIDHFRGFDSYWAVAFGAETAVEGEWIPGPGMALVSALKAACPELPVIAEDLGFLTPSVRQLLSQSGYPGMRVLQFGLHPGGDSLHLPHNCIRRCVYYTGTHDNTTAQGWIDSADPADVSFAVDYLNLSAREGLCFGLARGVWGSVADIAVVQVQDLLELPAAARMNTPGTAAGNWRFRLAPGALDGRLAERVAYYMRLYGRA